MKCLIYQVRVGTPPKYYDFCIDSVKLYCDRHGIDHVLLTEPKLKIKPKKWKRRRQIGLSPYL
jgi:hypothetical protein